MTVLRNCVWSEASRNLRGVAEENHEQAYLTERRVCLT
jgi:hypothetical protein